MYRAGSAGVIRNESMEICLRKFQIKNSPEEMSWWTGVCTAAGLRGEPLNEAQMLYAEFYMVFKPGWEKKGRTAAESLLKRYEAFPEIYQKLHFVIHSIFSHLRDLAGRQEEECEKTAGTNTLNTRN